MNNILDQFFTLPMLVYCIGIWFVVMVQRKIVETEWPQVKKSKLWNDLFLPLGPAGTGAISGVFMTMFPWPDQLSSPWYSRACVGIVCGLASGTLYKILKKFLISKSNENASEQDEQLPQ